MTQVASTAVLVPDTITSRRSIRDFTAEAITDDQVHALLHAAVLAPTAMHQEPWQFVVVQDREALRRYSEQAKTIHIEQTHMFRGLHDPSSTPKNGGFLRELSRPDFSIFYNDGTLILICARLDNPFAAADCWLAAENLMLAATGLGLGTCCIGASLTALNSAGIKNELAIPSGVSVVSAIIVGHPADSAKTAAAPSRKAPVILSWKRG
jgi:nitroreductase